MGNSKKNIKSQEEEPGGNRSCTSKKENWQVAYKSSIKSIDELSKYVFIKEKEVPILKEVARRYHMRATPYYLSLIENPSDYKDPIRKQCIPSVEELHGEFYEEIDPLGEEKTSPVSCLVHRYPDRVLLLVANCCFMYCRHCTRKRLWQDDITEPTLEDIEKALLYVKQNRQIREVIISGGDPLTLSTERLDYILSLVYQCKNIEVMRIGTRAPVVFPQRIDRSLCNMLGRYKNLWVNVQFNHPREITPASISACRRLQEIGIPISNQSVLLKGINDDIEIMKELCRKLQSIRVRPYYLFQCDPVVGASHFRTSVWKGVEITEGMRGYTSGMCIPNFIVDGIDGKGKVPLNPNYLISESNEGIILRNYKKESFFYYNPKQ